MTSKKKSTETQIAFERARYEYCAKLYEKEVERGLSLERRSQFYLSFITLVLGAIFLNLEYFEKVRDIILKVAPPSSITNTLYSSIIILSLSLLVALLSILEFNRLRTYTRTHPKNIITALFAPDSKFLKQMDEISLLEATSLGYAIALEANSRITDRLAKLVQVSSFCTFFVVLSLFVILGIISYLMLFV